MEKNPVLVVVVVDMAFVMILLERTTYTWRGLNRDSPFALGDGEG